MSDFSMISKERLQSILEAFRSVEWPLDPEVFKGIAADLGWTLEDESGNGMGLTANLSFNLDYVMVIVSEGFVTEVQLSVTDTLVDDDPDITRAAFKQLREYCAELFGDDGVNQSGRSRVYWDTPVGGRIVLECLDDTVLLDILSARYADIERAEQRQGLDPNVPIADHQESQR